MSNQAGAWHPDPSGRHELRYWDGTSWTEHVSDGGVTSTDAEGAAPPAGGPGAVFGASPGAGDLPGFGQAAPGFGQPPFGGPPLGQPPVGAAQVGYGVATISGTAQPLGGLAKALGVLLPITGVLSLVFAYALFSRANLLDDLLSASFQELQDADDLAAGTLLLFGMGTIATGVVWIIWQFRHAKNARLLGQTSGLGPGWAIGGWFVPLLGVVLPQLQLFQAAKASDPAGPGRDAVPPVVAVWWALWAVGSVLGGLSGRYTGQNEIDNFGDISDFQQADRLASFGALALAASAFAAMVVVRTLTARQQEALRARGVS